MPPETLGSPGPDWSEIRTLADLDYPFVRLVDRDVDEVESFAAVERLDDDDWVITGHGWICLLSPAEDGPTVITVEGWSDADPSDGEDWEQRHRGEVSFPSGTLWLSGGTDGGSVGQPIIVPRSATGRFDVRLQARTVLDGDGESPGAEVSVQLRGR